MMNNYFVTKEDLDEMRDKMFAVIARAFWQLEHKISLLIDVGFPKRDSTEKIKEKQMSDIKIKALIAELFDSGRKVRQQGAFRHSRRAGKVCGENG